ncbi:MAG: DNA-binding protein [Oscillospiraceae bacterium]|nr:DNA-binding protein [Oscillospiraceae bacterium]
MQYKRVQDHVILRIDRGEEILAALKTVCETEGIRLASVAALGAVDRFTVGVFHPDEKRYEANAFTGCFEIVSLTGTVTTKDGAFYAHLHMSAGNEKGQVFGGHLNEAWISATCELVLTVLDGTVERVFDEEIGLNLMKLD